MRRRMGSMRGLVVVVVAIAALGAAACTPETNVTLSQAQQTGISVTGTGSVSVRPDVARLSLGVETRRPTVAEARDEASQTMTALMDSLADNGVEERDIRTTSLSIYPEYRFDRDKEESSISGFVVTNQVQVTVRDLDRVSEILDEAVAAAGDTVRVNGISFEVDDPEEVLGEAREAAIENARERAEVLATAAGVSLGKVRSVSESGGIIPGPIFERAAADAGGGATPISAGESELQIQVFVVFEIE